MAPVVSKQFIIPHYTSQQGRYFLIFRNRNVWINPSCRINQLIPVLFYEKSEDFLT